VEKELRVLTIVEEMRDLVTAEEEQSIQKNPEPAAGNAPAV
jgi:hypothetical protein